MKVITAEDKMLESSKTYIVVPLTKGCKIFGVVMMAAKNNFVVRVPPHTSVCITMGGKNVFSSLFDIRDSSIKSNHLMVELKPGELDIAFNEMVAGTFNASKIKSFVGPSEDDLHG